MPADLVPILAKDEKKREQLLTATPPQDRTANKPTGGTAGAKLDLAAISALSGNNAAGSVSQANTPQLKEARLGRAAAAGAHTAGSATPSQRAVSGPSKRNFSLLPEIPSFAELKALKAAKAGSVSKVEAWVNNTAAASASSTPVMDIPVIPPYKMNLAAKEFRPNPKATEFTPVRSAASECSFTVTDCFTGRLISASC